MECTSVAVLTTLEPASVEEEMKEMKRCGKGTLSMLGNIETVTIAIIT